jgi:hypothetical protein
MSDGLCPDAVTGPGTAPPIFVVGFPRSGTTLLQALLGAHPRIAAPPETYFLFRVYHLRDYFGDLRDDLRLRRVVHETLNPPVPLLADSGFDEDRLFERLKRSDRSYRAVFDLTMRDFAERHGKQRWSDKTPGQTASDAWELFPEAQVVHIVRDPRDVVASLRSTPWEQDAPASVARGYLRFTLDNVTAGTRRGPGQYMRIRYEDMCRDPDNILRLICAFLNEEYDPGMLAETGRRQPTIAPAAAPWQLRALDAVGPSYEGKWRERLKPVDRARVATIVKPLLAPYGYAPSAGLTQLVGLGLNLALTPVERARGLRVALGARKDVRSPALRYQAVRRFQEGQARLVGNTPESLVG